MNEDFTPAEQIFLNKISSYCAYRERSISEVHTKLKLMGCSKNQIDKITAWLIDNNFLNQSRFESSFVRSKVNQNKWGRLKIKNALRQKGFKDDALLNDAISKIDLETYENNLIHILQRKADELLRKQSDHTKEKLIRHAQSKGFTLDEVFSALKKINFNVEEE